VRQKKGRDKDEGKEREKERGTGRDRLGASETEEE